MLIVFFWTGGTQHHIAVNNTDIDYLQQYLVWSSDAEREEFGHVSIIS